MSGLCLNPLLSGSVFLTFLLRRSASAEQLRSLNPLLSGSVFLTEKMTIQEVIQDYQSLNPLLSGSVFLTIGPYTQSMNNLA